MIPRFSLLVATVLLLCPTAPRACASAHLAEISARVVAYGQVYFDEEEGLRRFDEQSGFVRDWDGRLNVAEATLNYAGALFEVGTDPAGVAGLIGATLSQQDRDQRSATCGLFRWFAEDEAEYEVIPTLYLAPVLAHLTRELSRASGAASVSSLSESCRLALQALLARPVPAEEVGALMYAGAVCSLGATLGESAGQERGANVVRQWLGGIPARGASEGHRLTYDALKIGGLRWAWQSALDDTARVDAEAALGLLYRDLLQRYQPRAAAVGGAVRQAYAADYTGATGVGRYLLAADLPSALDAAEDVGPLAMYFGLSDYQLPPELRALAEDRDQPYEVRTRTPEDEAAEKPELTTCTYVTSHFTLGAMSGSVSDADIPILATWDLAERPTSYFYLLGAPAHLSSVQSGPLALCSFNFDNVGVLKRRQVAVRGVLGLREGMGTVLVNGHEWIGEPEALSQGTTIALRRGSSYLGVKILECGSIESGGLEGGVSPGVIAWSAEGDAGRLMLDVYGRQAKYALRAPLQNVRVGLLLEVAAQSAYESLENFARHVARRRVGQHTEYRKRRARELEEGGPLREHEPKSKAEMVFVRSLEHSMSLDADDVQLGLVEDLLANRLISRTLPVELSPNYLWLSPALALEAGVSVQAALGP